MMKLLKSGWLASLIGALLYLGTTMLIWRPPAPSQAAPQSSAPAETTAPVLDFRNPELDLLIEELKKEKEALAKRQSQLNELAERLRIERLELNQVTQMVHQAEAQFDRNVVRVVQEELVNLKKLARTYAGMSPEGAALIFKQMDEMTLLRVLALMKDSETAPILEAMAKQGEADAKRVAAISERLRVLMPSPKDSKRNL
jgi:flagellar motility protein MotE (MotC chaperone)